MRQRSDARAYSEVQTKSVRSGGGGGLKRCSRGRPFPYCIQFKSLQFTSFPGRKGRSRKLENGELFCQVE
jgi:hypothetical protein